MIYIWLFYDSFSGCYTKNRIALNDQMFRELFNYYICKQNANINKYKSQLQTEQ